jgi:hypothetical protein
VVVVTRGRGGAQQLRVLHGTSLQPLLQQRLPPTEVVTAMLCTPVARAAADPARHSLVLASYTVDRRTDTLRSMIRVYEVTWRRPRADNACAWPTCVAGVGVSAAGAMPQGRPTRQ